MHKKELIEFKSDNNILRGWFYIPENNSPKPCIIMTPGFSALKEHYLDKFAVYFAERDFCVLVYDNRNFGESDGVPRLEVDPQGQVTDLKNAISYAQTKPQVNPKEIALWGTSFSAGIAIVTAANDQRVKCVVAQVPFVHGHHRYLRISHPQRWEVIEKQYEADRIARAAGKEPVAIPVIQDSSTSKPLIKTPTARDFFCSVSTWENKVTLKSIENTGDFMPINHLPSFNYIPILFIVAKEDSVNLTNLALKAYEQTRVPKKLVMLDGDHFTPYVEHFDICAHEACEWFNAYLKK